MMWVKKEDLGEEEDAEDDPVVHEVKVFLSKALKDKLYLVQYPLRPKDRSFEEETILEAKIKPEQEKIQLTFGVDTTSSRYDKHVGARMKAQQNPGGKKPSGEEYDSDYEEIDSRPLYDEFVMESSGIPDPAKSTRYVLGTVRPEGLFITPFKAIVQMRPSFEHLNKAVDEMTKPIKKNSKNAAAESAGSTEEEVDEEPTKVTVKFSQSRAGATGKDRNSKSYSAQAKIKEEEPWIDVKFNKKSEDEDNREYFKLFSGNCESDTPFYVIRGDEYMETMIPKHFELDVESPFGERKKTAQLSKATKMLNVNQIKLLSFGEQLKTIMRNAGVLSYAQIDNYLRTKLECSYDDTTLLRAIQTVATLVQGCWVVRSDLVFPVDYKSGAHGIPGNLMQKARDAILHQFVERRWVDRKRMCALTHLPTEEVTEILSKIAERKEKSGGVPRHGWEFRLPFDHDFVVRHPEVVQRQRLIYEMKISKKERTMSSGSGSGSSRMGERDSQYKPHLGPLSRRRSRASESEPDLTKI